MKTMSKILLGAVFSTALLLAVACSNNQSKGTKTEQHAGLQYTCPMHPEVVKSEPGNCPECNMALVKKKNEHEGHSHEGHNH